MSKILMAIQPTERAFLQSSLEDRYQFVWCSTLPQAQAGLAPDIDMILCNDQFDGGRMFDLAELAQSHSANCGIPLYGIIVSNCRLPLLLQELRSAMEAFNAQGVLDLAGLRRECGDDEARRMLRTAIEGILLRRSSKSSQSSHRSSDKAVRKGVHKVVSSIAA